MREIVIEIKIEKKNLFVTENFFVGTFVFLTWEICVVSHPESYVTQLNNF